ncbi:formamidopyrimidine-DNA glycosylase [Haloferula luteola]|uniref:Formamidopyrimidine-DNA glycosylase n=1 Tax=Haloferula luteola TaxID=595692 RepID=A0A840UXP8_9BACT|nr:bifunctional DNA-formamidopyrimidine glycosylase/DNA-(apurinic or apyrimidinic site) lyase [Haloferula luteola]MBB5350552.1 formamidopyrimidine-DNA glycosylase [Haloferula luteola]
MPELPEVETTRRGIAPHLVGRSLREITVRNARLRLPVPSDLDFLLHQRVTELTRRSKYLLVTFEHGERLLIHLGMSGSLRICESDREVRKHDHVIFTLEDGKELRFHDPRRFGMVLPIGRGDPSTHALLSHLGPEPLGPDFTPEGLYTAVHLRKAAIKIVIMDAKVVVGVGNIYANEALFRSGIRPSTPANRVSRMRMSSLHAAIITVLQESIEQGGTTLRDFVNSDGQPGYFRQRLDVYDRTGEPCRRCQTPILHAVMGQRSTFWCPRCQK